MIPQIAAAACAAFVVYLFLQDSRANPDTPAALWVPLAWMFLAGSRWVSSWLDLGAPITSVDSYSEGSPVDRAAFLMLIVAGVGILARRKIHWGELLRRNRLLALYLAYCLLSIIWSDQPLVSVKRWIKDLGNPIMVLVIYTAPVPLAALAQTLRRLSFLLLPLSVLFVKFYPDLGRVYHYDGTPMYTGVGHQKNDLGLMCCVTGIYFLWQLTIEREHFAAWRRARRYGMYVLMCMSAWLLYMSNSQTSLVCLVVAGLVLAAWRIPFVREQPVRLVSLLACVALTYAVLDMTVDVKNVVLGVLGRDPSLTNRTELWSLLYSIGTENSVLGSGFMSFWSGARMQAVWDAMGAGINQAHSGYIEQYLNLGYVGVAFVILIMTNTLLDARSQLDSNPSFAILRICFVVAAALYNYTEASFYGINNMWILLLLAVTRPLHPGVASEAEATWAATSEQDAALAAARRGRRSRSNKKVRPVRGFTTPRTELLDGRTMIHIAENEGDSRVEAP